MKVLVAGLLGGVVLFVLIFVANVVFKLQVNMDMKQVRSERQVYEVLKANIANPGRYICNPALTDQGRFPDNAEVYSIFYSGMGHGTAGKNLLIELGTFLLAPVIGAFMLSATSARVKSNYAAKVLFFSAIGLLIALCGDLSDMGIGGYPMRDALTLAVFDVVIWTLAGLVVAGMIRPRPEVMTAA